MPHGRWVIRALEKSIPDINLFGNFVQEIKILGIYFCLDVKVKENLNFKEILSKIKKIVRMVERKGFNTYGENAFNENMFRLL